VSRTAPRHSILVDRVLDQLPDAPTRLVERLRRKDVPLFAAALAFYAVVSFAPLTITVLWVISLMVGDDRVRQLAQELQRAAPQGLGAGNALNQVANAGTALGVVSLASALWPASAYGSGLGRAFHELSGQAGPPKPARGRALTLAVLLPAFVIGGLIASYAGTAVVGESGISLVIGWALALAFGFAATTAIVTLIYRLFPGRRFRWVQTLRAAAPVAAGISVLSLLFVVFLNLGANFQAHYATSGIASVVLLALWLYLSNMMLLAGYELSLDPSSTSGPNASRRRAAKR
jgi:membrane protein